MRKQYGDPYQLYTVSADEQPPNGLEPQGSGPACPAEDLLEERRKDGGAAEGKEEEGRVEEEPRCFSAQELLNWEKRTRKKNGKYIEAIQARVGSQIGAKVYFQAAISDMLRGGSMENVRRKGALVGIPR